MSHLRLWAIRPNSARVQACGANAEFRLFTALRHATKRGAALPTPELCCKAAGVMQHVRTNRHVRADKVSHMAVSDRHSCVCAADDPVEFRRKPGWWCRAP